MLATRLYDLEMQRAVALGDKASTPIESCPARSGLARVGHNHVARCAPPDGVAVRDGTPARTGSGAGTCVASPTRSTGNSISIRRSIGARLVARMDEVTAQAVNLNRGASDAWDYARRRAHVHGPVGCRARSERDGSRARPRWGVPLWRNRTWLMTMVGRPAEAVRLAHEAIAMDPPGDWWVVRAECEALLLLGQVCRGRHGVRESHRPLRRRFRHRILPRGSLCTHGKFNPGPTRKPPKSSKARRDSPSPALRAKRYSTHPEYMRLAEEHWYSGLRKAGIPEK